MASEESAKAGHLDVGDRLRTARESEGLSLRELARRLELSASALSQIETGKSRPSVKTLYAIVSELGVSMDELFQRPGSAAAAVPTGEGTSISDQPSPAAIVQKAGSRPSIELDSGVSWERLTTSHDPDVDFLFTTYEPGGASSSNDMLVRHNGREYGIILAGEVELTVGFETYQLEPGDSVSFNSQEPHRLTNRSDKPTTAVWFVIGRRQSDPRKPSFDAAASDSEEG